jgi:hypothetical protein
MKTSLAQLIGALVICGVTSIGFSAWYAFVADKSAAVMNLEKQIAIKTQTEGRIISARATLADLVNDEAAVQSYFIPEASIVGFINGLEARGRAQGAFVSVLSVAAAPVGGRPALTLTLSVKGAFDAVLRTVGSIEYSPHSLSVSTLALAQDAPGSWRADLKLIVGSVGLPVTKTP